MYKRNDARDRRHYADLEVVDDRIMLPHDLSVCPPPPDDVHGFTALEEDTHIIAVVGGNYKPIREYYNPQEKYYIERHQQQWRLARKP